MHEMRVRSLLCRFSSPFVCMPEKFSTIKLCAVCSNVSEDSRRQSLHVVHPVTEELLQFNVRGEAVCPTCRALWRRQARGVTARRAISKSSCSALAAMSFDNCWYLANCSMPAGIWMSPITRSG